MRENERAHQPRESAADHVVDLEAAVLRLVGFLRTEELAQSDAATWIRGALEHGRYRTRLRLLVADVEAALATRKPST